MTILHEALETSIGMGWNEIQERQELRQAIKRILDFVDLENSQGLEYVDEEVLDSVRFLKAELGLRRAPD